MLTVSGCSNSTVAGIVQGGFLSNGSNHNKPVFKKEGGQGAVSVLIYFWDERDGASFSGWWFGPKVGGDQVWAYNSNKSSSGPPTTGWRVPWDGPPDESLRVVLHAPGSHPESSRGPATVPPRDSRQRQDSGGRQTLVDEDDRRRRDRETRERADSQRVREEEERRRRDDEMRRRREEEDRRRREREEELRRVREEEQRRAREEEKKRRDEAERRKAEEAERRRKDEERRHAEEEKRKRETAAALLVRKVIQRVRVASPENYEQLRGELEEALAKNLEAMGPHGGKVSEEAEQTLRQAQRRIDEINQKRAEDERRREEEEKRRAEEKEKVEQIMQEAADQLKSGEGLLKDITEAAEKIPEGKDAEPQNIISAVDDASKVYEESQAGLEIVLDWFTQKKKELSDNHANRTQMMDFDDMVGKLEQGRRTLLENMEKGKTTKELAARRAVAMKKTQERRQLFEVRDADKDGKLSQKEIVAFSKEVHSFEMPSEVLAKIMLVLEPVTFEKFHALHQKVAIAKIEAEARTRRSKLEAERKAFQSVVDEIEEHVAAAETDVEQAESDAKPLTRDQELPAAEMRAIAEKSQALVAKSEEALRQAGDRLKDADKDCAGNPGLNFENRSSLNHRRERTQTRADRVVSTLKRAVEQAVKKAAVEVDAMLTKSVTAARKLMGSESKTAEQIFEGLGGDTLTLEKFTNFVKGLPDFQISEGEAERLYEHVAGGPDAKIGEEQFVDMLRLYYKVVKGTVMAEAMSIKTKAVRRLEGDETLECLEGPMKDDSCGVQRVKCKALSDGATGWVTLQGNQGTPFLVQDGNFLSIRERLAAEKVVEEKRREAEEKAAAEEAAAAAAGDAAAAGGDAAATEKKKPADAEMVVSDDEDKPAAAVEEIGDEEPEEKQAGEEKKEEEEEKKEEEEAKPAEAKPAEAKPAEEAEEAGKEA